MRILFLSDNFPPERNAAATRVYERALYWRRWGHEVTVVTSAPNFPEGKLFPGYRNKRSVEELDGIKVVRVKTFISPNKGVKLRILDFTSYMVAGFLAALKEARPDVVVATSPQFFAAVAGCGVGMFRRLPFIFELSDLWPASIHAVGAMRSGRALSSIERLELALYRKSAQVVALTHAFKEDLVSRGVPASKISVVRNGVDLDRYEMRPKDPSLSQELGLQDKFVVGYIGTHGMAHGLDNVLRAAESLADDDSIRFLFVGAGATRDALVQQAKDRNLKNVVFVAAQPKESIAAYWAQCDVALVHLKDHPVFSTVIPSKIFEAMAMGLPIVLASPKGEAQELIEQDGGGLWIEPENPQELADTVLKLKSDRSLRESLSSQGLAAAQMHTREEQARQMLDVFERVLRPTGDADAQPSDERKSRASERPKHKLLEL